MSTFLGATRQIQGSLLNESITQQVVNAADTYLTGSQLAPASTLAVRTHFIWRGVMSKSAAGVVAPVFKIRVGTVGTIADAIRVTLTSPDAQTAAVDYGSFEIYAILRAIGATAVIDACLKIGHGLASTGFSVVPSSFVHATGAAFDLGALTKPYLGLSVDPGTAGVWTFEQVVAEMKQT